MTFPRSIALSKDTLFSPLSTDRHGRFGYWFGSGRSRSRCLAGVVCLGLSVGFAQAQCVIIKDSDLYEEHKEQAILLMQYGDLVVRATGGKIRCNEDPDKSRQTCTIEGPGEMLVDAPDAEVVVQLEGDQGHIVHLSADGVVTCVP